MHPNVRGSSPRRRRSSGAATRVSALSVPPPVADAPARARRVAARPPSPRAPAGEGTERGEIAPGARARPTARARRRIASSTCRESRGRPRPNRGASGRAWALPTQEAKGLQMTGARMLREAAGRARAACRLIDRLGGPSRIRAVACDAHLRDARDQRAVIHLGRADRPTPVAPARVAQAEPRRARRPPRLVNCTRRGGQVGGVDGQARSVAVRAAGACHSRGPQLPMSESGAPQQCTPLAPGTPRLYRSSPSVDERAAGGVGGHRLMV